MKAADLAIIKGLKEFVSEFFPDYQNFSLTGSQVSKSKDNEKGRICVSFDLSKSTMADGMNIPDAMKNPEYSSLFKVALSKKLGKTVKYLEVNWSYSENQEKEIFMGFSLEIKLD